MENIENTLVIGNGFSRAVFEGVPSWEKLFEGETSDIENYTILYELYLLKNGNSSEEDVKKKIGEKISCHISDEKLKEDSGDLDKFGWYLKENKVHNIITTNYDRGIEIILCNKCGYKRVEKPEGMVPEEVFSIRTYKEFENSEMNHRVKLWQIHGNVERIKSISLGFDQYCASLSKLCSYLKGQYESDKGPKCRTSMIEKCETKTFDGLSWAELFFNTNVYIVGFGMDFSEIDIWWLLNKRIRIKNRTSMLQNNIYYLYNKLYDIKKDRFEALKAFQVKCVEINPGNNYIEMIFNQMH